jgi:hypothetical protein
MYKPLVVVGLISAALLFALLSVHEEAAAQAEEEVAAEAGEGFAEGLAASEAASGSATVIEGLGAQGLAISEQGFPGVGAGATTSFEGLAVGVVLSQADLGAALAEEGFAAAEAESEAAFGAAVADEDGADVEVIVP